ncbi:unnamed protein product [Musa acuminata var. zebrina]
MHCTVGVVRNRTESPNQFSVNVPSSDLGQCLKELLKSGIGSGIIFEVGDETFQAHKQILAARSPVFNAQFFGLIGNPNVDRVVVEDVEPPFLTLLQAMLIFIYSDKLPDVHELTSSFSMYTFTTMIQHLFLAAVMKTEGFNFLEAMCPSILVDVVDVDSDHRNSSSTMGIHSTDSQHTNWRR